MIELINQIVANWSNFFIVSIVQNTLFLSIVMIILFFLKNKNAQVSYLIALVGLIKLIVPPFLPASLYNLFKINYINTPPDEMLANSIISVNSGFSQTATLSPLFILFIIWLTGFGLVLLFSLRAYMKLRRKLKNAESIKLHNSFLNISLDKVEIRKSKQINVPMAMGIFSKKIFIPTHWDAWSKECKEMIIKHEMEHLRRNDTIVQLLQLLVKAIYFFHPLVWILNSRIELLKEITCDDRTINSFDGASIKYTRYLVQIAESAMDSRPQWTSASALLRQKKELLKRVKYQMKEYRMNKISKLKSALLFILVFSVAISLSWYHVDAQEIKTTPKKIVKDVGKIYGNIVNSKSNEIIKGVKVEIKDTKLWAITDDKGNFFIPMVPVSKDYEINVGKKGFKTVKIRNVNVKKFQSTKLDLKLDPVVTN